MIGAGEVVVCPGSGVNEGAAGTVGPGNGVVSPGVVDGCPAPVEGAVCVDEAGGVIGDTDGAGTGGTAGAVTGGTGETGAVVRGIVCGVPLPERNGDVLVTGTHGTKGCVVVEGLWEDDDGVLCAVDRAASVKNALTMRMRAATLGTDGLLVEMSRFETHS